MRFHYHVYQTLVEMMNQRGYEDDEEEQPSRARLLRLCHSNFPVVWRGRDTDGRGVVVLFPDMEKLGIAHLRRYLEELGRMNSKAERVILITRNKISTLAEKTARLAQNMVWEFFLESHLRHNITKHVYYIPHYPLSNMEKAELLRRYFIDPARAEEQLPGLPASDPVALFFNFNPGTVVRIGPRKMGDLMPYYYYRIVL